MAISYIHTINSVDILLPKPLCRKGAVYYGRKYSRLKFWENLTHFFSIFLLFDTKNTGTDTLTVLLDVTDNFQTYLQLLLIFKYAVENNDKQSLKNILFYHF